MGMLAKNKFKLTLLYILQILLVISPVIAVIIIKRNDYFTTANKLFSLSFAGVTGITILVLQVVGKTPKNIHILIKLGVITLILWLLRPILDELCLLVTACFGGELLGFLTLSYPIKMQKLKVKRLELAIAEKSLALTADEQTEWSGRV